MEGVVPRHDAAHNAHRHPLDVHLERERERASEREEKKKKLSSTRTHTAAASTFFIIMRAPTSRGSSLRYFSPLAMVHANFSHVVST